MKTVALCPQIYVACLAAYNDGILHGEWIDATQDPEDIHAEIQDMLKKSPIPNAEEWAIHDYSDFGGMRLSEYEDIEHVHELAKALEECGEAFALYADLVGEDYATVESFNDAYHGEWDSEEDFAYDWWEQAGYLAQIPEELRCYIDWERVARDLFLDGFMSARLNGNVHVFSRY